MVDIHLDRATAKNARFQLELDKAVFLFSGWPTYDVENWMASNIMAAFGGGVILKRPPRAR